MGISGIWNRVSLRYARAFNVVISIILFISSLACYALYIILFLRPKWYHRDSLIHPTTSNVTPPVIVGLITALFAATTGALVVRSVEHSLWHSLTPRYPGNRISVGESRRLAEWSTSSIARMLYIFSGSSWLLKMSGILLLSLAVLNPVLVSGISQTQSSNTQTKFQASTGSRWAGFLDSSNNRYNGGNFRDVPGTVASVISLSSLSPPASSVCDDAGTRNCSVSATASTIRASCSSTTISNPDGIGTQLNQLVYTPFCSSSNPNICASLLTSNPNTFANFTGGFSGNCDPDRGVQDCPGEFATIFGVWIDQPQNGTSLHDINTVDCALTIGNVTITQSGQSPPVMDSNGFVKSKYNRTDYAEITQLARIYYEANGGSSPYSFTGKSSGGGANTLYESPIATLLLGSTVNATGDIVAKGIEAAFQMGTLTAFSRKPQAADLSFTYTVPEAVIYTYDWKVLLVLIAPFLATLFGCWNRWWVGGRDVVGYDVVTIAKMGPVQGLEGKGERGYDDYEHFKVHCTNEGGRKRLLAAG